LTIENRAICLSKTGKIATFTPALQRRSSELSSLLFGDDVGGAIVSDKHKGGGSFLTELARAEIQGKDLPDLETMFSEARAVVL
jgi:hypothetical protein